MNGYVDTERLHGMGRSSVGGLTWKASGMFAGVYGLVFCFFFISFWIRVILNERGAGRSVLWSLSPGVLLVM